MAETIHDRGKLVKQTQHMSPGYVGTAEKACAFVDEALTEIGRLTAALDDVRNSRMPGESRVIAIRALTIGGRDA